MRVQISILLGLAAVTSFGQAVIVKGSGGYGMDSPYNRQYDRRHEVVIDGKITGKMFSAPMHGMAEAMSLVMKTNKGTSVTVGVGPRWFVANQSAHINVGDSVRIIGSPATINGKQMVLAKQIVTKKNDKVLAVRDINGSPYWILSRVASNQKAPDNAEGGTVLSTNTMNYQGTPYAGYVLQTPNGNVNILTAPQWYMNGQDQIIQPGAYVQFVRSAQPINLGNNVFLADTMFSNGSTMVFQNNGVPVWYGYGR